jgi:hypothetical protein
MALKVPISLEMLQKPYKSIKRCSLPVRRQFYKLCISIIFIYYPSVKENRF